MSSKPRSQLTSEQLAKVRKYHRDYKAKKLAADPEAVNAAARARYAANPQKRRTLAKNWRENNKEKFLASRKADYAKNKHKWITWQRLLVYGLTPEKFAEMFAKQNGCCAICDVEFEHGVGNSSPRQMHVDHDHATNKVRGLLCRDCNLGLGRFHDDQRSLERAIRYLASDADRASLARNDDVLATHEPFTYVA